MCGPTITCSTCQPLTLVFAQLWPYPTLLRTSSRQGLWHSSEMVVERGFYCCFDPFTRLDVRCELCVPGGVVCGAIDAEVGVGKCVI